MTRKPFGALGPFAALLLASGPRWRPISSAQQRIPFVIAVALALGGCGSPAATTFATDGTQDDGGSEASMLGASIPVADSGAPPPTLLVSTDAGPPPPPMGACKPGTYAGMFTTNVTVPDAGSLGDFFSLISWNGMLSLTLEGKASTTQNGEFSTTTLVIAPGAKLTGSDQYGGTFDATVSGQLDCPSRALVGTLDNGTYTNTTFLGLFGDGGTVTMVGTLSGTYDPSATPVALDNGSISASSPDIQGLEADGTWAATLQ